MVKSKVRSTIISENLFQLNQWITSQNCNQFSSKYFQKKQLQTKITKYKLAFSLPSKIIIKKLSISSPKLGLELRFILFHQSTSKNRFKSLNRNTSKMGCTQTQAQCLDQANQKSNVTENTQSSPDAQARRTYLQAILSGIQELSCRNREERLKLCLQQSLENHKQYIMAIQKSIGSQQAKISQLSKALTKQLGTSEFTLKELQQDIVTYLTQRGVDQKRVQDWITAKIKIVELQGRTIAAKLKGIQIGRNISMVQVFQTVIEDKVQTDKGFLLSVAYEFIFQNNLSSRAKWTICLQQMQKQLDFMSK